MNGPGNTGYERDRALMEMRVRLEQEALRRAIGDASRVATPVFLDNGYRPQDRGTVMRIQGLAAGLLLSLPIWAAIIAVVKWFGLPLTHFAAGVFFGGVATVALWTVGRGVVRACEWVRDR